MKGKGGGGGGEAYSSVCPLFEAYKNYIFSVIKYWLHIINKNGCRLQLVGIMTRLSILSNWIGR